jgi:hypothetical protein
VSAPDVPEVCGPPLREARRLVEQALAVEGLWFRDRDRLHVALRSIDSVLDAVAGQKENTQP